MTDHLGHVPRRGEKTEIDDIALKFKGQMRGEFISYSRYPKPQTRLKKDDNAVTYLNGEFTS